jgi:thioredoxin reductase
VKQLSPYEYLIIGAGPAGLQLGFFLQQQGWRFLIVEAAPNAGSFFATLPRHGKMISINKRYTGYEDAEAQLRYDWNSLLCDDPNLLVRHYSPHYFPFTAEYQQYLCAFAQRYRLPIVYSSTITNVTRNQEGFEMTDQIGNHYLGKRLIVATGLGRVPNLPAIAGIELATHYQSYSLNPEDYQDQRVLIIGKGNGAFETANALLSTTRCLHLCSPDSVKWAWETHFMGHVRTVNAEFLDTFYLKGQNALLDARIEKLEQGTQGIIASLTYTHAGGQTMQMVYDRVLLCTGFRFDTSPFDNTCQPDLFAHDTLPAMTVEWESTNVRDLYFAGTLMQMRDYHHTMSNVIHGFRFNIRFLSQVFAQKYHQKPLTYRPLPFDPEELTQYFLVRASHAAALFLQPGYFCDCCVIARQAQQVLYFENMPVEYVRERQATQEETYYTLTLEYGQNTSGFRPLERDPNPDHASNDFFLHPVIRYFRGLQQLACQHLPENLESNWLSDHHMFILTTEVPGKHSSQEMLDYHQRLRVFIQQQFANE